MNLSFTVISGMRYFIVFSLVDISNSQSPNYVILTIAVVCIGGLFLPTEKEGSSLYNGFHISVGLKLVFSYVLGKFIFVMTQSIKIRIYFFILL